MLEIRGKYNTAKVFTNVIEQGAISQIIGICNMEIFKDSRIRIMPDVHIGNNCTIGTTMTIKDKVIPNLVGVDIGCGMEVTLLGNGSIDYTKLDRVIKVNIPSGFSVRSKAHPFMKKFDLSELYCYKSIKTDIVPRTLGTLGGGNHFIEIDQSNTGENYLLIHSGSRNLGVLVAKFYQREAFNRLKNTVGIKAQKDLAYCDGDLFEQYVHDMNIVQRFATLNRKTIACEILKDMGIKSLGSITTVHNYIDTEKMILRKGAVSAMEGEKLIIPMNMRDGSLICTGKGNPDWNYSAPHGAGRIMSREQAREVFSLEDFKKSMIGVFSTSVNTFTLDESPMAYKSLNDIVGHINDTVRIDEILKPVYNYKST